MDSGALFLRQGLVVGPVHESWLLECVVLYSETWAQSQKKLMVVQKGSIPP